MKETSNVSSVSLLQSVLKGIHEKKGTDITELDLSHIHNAICKSFVVCSGGSTTQVEAIAGSIIDEVRKETGEKPWHTEGLANKEWVLIDFVDVVVHIFQPHIRTHYGLEDLWADAKITHHETIS